MKIRQEVKIALLVIAALLLLFWGFNFLKGKNVLVSGSQYYGVYDRLEGLTEGNPIYYKGYRIGNVLRINFESSPTPFLVRMQITENIKLPSNTIAKIHNTDIMGSKAIEIILGDSQDFLLPGDTLLTEVTEDLMDQVTQELRPIKEKSENMISSIDSVITNINKLFNEDMDQMLNDLFMTIKNLKNTSSAIEASFTKEGNMGRSLSNVEDITENIKDQLTNFNTTVENLAKLTGNLTETDFQKIGASADSVLNELSILLTQATKGEGTLGLLMDDPELYLNMADATANMDRLLIDMRNNPKRYLRFSALNFGRKVYVTTEEKLAQEKEIVFKVKIAEAKKPLELRNVITEDKYRIKEYFDGKNYIYTIGESSSFNKTVNIKDEINEEFPEATVIAFKKGKIIKLSRALKQISP